MYIHTKYYSMCTNSLPDIMQPKPNGVHIRIYVSGEPQVTVM